MVDDGSSDNSVEVAEQEGAIVLELPDTSGPARARNHGAERASGDILLFIDNIFRFVQAGSEVSALLGRMPSAVGYQPNLASELGELLESAAVEVSELVVVEAEEVEEGDVDVADVVDVVHAAGIGRKVARLKPIGVLKG